MDSTHLAEVETCFLNARLSKCVIFLNIVKNFANTPITIRFSIVELVGWWCGLVQPVHLLRAKIRQKDCGGKDVLSVFCSPDAVNDLVDFPEPHLTWMGWQGHSYPARKTFQDFVWILRRGFVRWTWNKRWFKVNNQLEVRWQHGYSSSSGKKGYRTYFRKPPFLLGRNPSAAVRGTSILIWCNTLSSSSLLSMSSTS